MTDVSRSGTCEWVSVGVSMCVRPKWCGPRALVFTHRGARGEEGETHHGGRDAEDVADRRRPPDHVVRGDAHLRAVTDGRGQ